MNYQTYENYSQLIPCESPNVRLPSFMLDHPNLRGRAGYGIAESCLIDNYNNLVKNDELMTRDKCKIQLFSRIFTGQLNYIPSNFGFYHFVGFSIQN